MTVTRKEVRQHSKSTLARAAEILLVVERRRWRRRMAWAVAGTLAFGTWLGAAVAHLVMAWP